MNSLIQRSWNRLALVDSLVFVSTSNADQTTGWIGEARGRVEVRVDDFDCLTFIEAGTWRTPAGRVFEFSNSYRWQREKDRIKLWHLRFGPEQPVYLFDLVPAGEHTMISDTPHVCSEDLYAASLELTPDEIELTWKVSGPAKNERIDYRYWQADVS